MSVSVIDFPSTLYIAIDIESLACAEILKVLPPFYKCIRGQPKLVGHFIEQSEFVDIPVSKFPSQRVMPLFHDYEGPLSQ